MNIIDSAEYNSNTEAVDREDFDGPTDEELDDTERAILATLEDPDRPKREPQALDWHFETQAELLGLILHDAAFVSEQQARIRPTYFKIGAQSLICRLALDHFRTFRSLPSRAQLAEAIREATREKTDDTRRYHEEQLDKVWKISPPPEARAYYGKKLAAVADHYAAFDTFQKAMDDKKASGGLLSAAKLAAEMTKAAAEIGATSAAPVTFKPMADWLNLSPPKWLVRDVLRCGQTVTLYGPSGSLKSFVALDLALSVAYHRRFGGKLTRPGRVAYVYTEAPEGGAQRIRAWMKAKGVTEPTPNLIYSEIPLALTEEGAVDRLLTGLAGTWPQDFPDLIVIDTLSKNFGGGDENSSDDMKRFTQAVNEIRRRTGASVIVIHHTGKDTTKEERGHSSLRGDMDASIKVVRDRDAGTVKIESVKAKDDTDSGWIAFRVERVDLGSNDDIYTGTEPVSSLILKLITEQEAKEAQATADMLDNVALLEPLAKAPLGMREWRNMAGIRAERFGYVRDRLTESGYIAKGEGRKDPWTLTEYGHKYLKQYRDAAQLAAVGLN